MKLPAFDHKEQKWDQWKEFYVGHGGRGYYDSGLFTQFTTGELICTSHFRTSSGWGNSSHSRGEFEQLGLSVFQLSDSWNPTRDGKQFYDPANQCFVKKTWLPQAVPMLWDRGCNRVVGIGYRDLSKDVPSRFAGRCRVYWPGEGRNPVGSPVQYHKLAEFSKEERREAREKALIVKAQGRIGVVQGLEKGWWRGDKQVPLKDMLATPVSNMSDEFKCRVIKFGVTTGYDAVETEYLEVR